MTGILLIDKPIGPSSFEVVRQVRKLSGIKKVGHTGTLDPLASGLMVVCLGSYTKLSCLFTDKDKLYETTITIGTITTTDDSEGQVIANKPWAHLTEQDIVQAISKFTGKIMQVPPQFSAIKIAGKRAYEMARKKCNFELAPRPIEIFENSLIDILLPRITLRIHCSKGTYIRAIARDLGTMLNVGAFAQSIRRIRLGNFWVNDAISLKDLTANNFFEHVLLGSKALNGIEQIVISFEEKENIIHGRRTIFANPINAQNAIATFNKEPIAILTVEKSKTLVKRVIVS